MIPVGISPPPPIPVSYIYTLEGKTCNLVLNPEAGRSLARLRSRLSRIYVQIFQTPTLSVTLHFWSKSGCGATLGATHVQVFQTLCPDFPDSNSRRDSATLGLNQRGRPLARLISRFSRLNVFSDSKSRRESAIWV